MEWFSGSSQNYTFVMFSVSHFVMIALLFIGSFFLFLLKERLKSIEWRRMEIGAALSLLLIEIGYHLWMIKIGIWHVSHALPLELCSISLILAILLLWTRKVFIYELLLFTALLGASQAIFTPLLHFDFPHFRFVHFFYTHLMMIWVALYFTWVKGYRPTIWSVLKLLIFLNILLPIIMAINKLVNGNYMFLNHKPKTGSLLDFLGPYPIYIFSMEGLLIILSLVIWIIFRKKNQV
ncbi:MAG: TIGR02206 family membrane protein [Neobacillus sp.]